MNAEPSEAGHPLPRMTTGDPHLDAVLGGGFPANSINILMGEPGSGKTILAERLIFANAGEGDRPILYLTTLSEPLDKVVRYLQQFSFFDEAKLGSVIHYESIGDDLLAHGVGMLVPRLKEVITTQKPKIIVIDSFKAIHDLDTSRSDMRRMLYELAGLLTAYETTAFLLGEYNAGEIAEFPEFAVADSMVELARDKLGTKDERYLRVLKLRGSAYLEGLHGFTVTPDGLDVSPRLTSPEIPPSYGVRNERVQTGIEGLDRMLGGGLPAGRSTFVLGPTGSGKSTLAMQFVLTGIHHGEPSLYVHFEENPSQIVQQIAALGVDPEEAARKGLHFLYASPVELQIDSILSEMFERVVRGGIRRVVVDGVGDLIVAASDTQRLHGYLYALAQHFSVRGVSTLFLHETTERAPGLETRVSPLADNILRLDIELGTPTQRSLRIVKARGIEHDLEKRTMTITRHGIRVE